MKTGECHICNSVGDLSFEHVPPRAAFNDRLVISVKFEQAITLGPGEEARGSIQQRGAGGYTLCTRCNNLTGKWYGARFVDWCYQGMDILQRSGGIPTLIYITYAFPLAILKEIITMFFSVNTPSFARANPELVKFVLNRDKKYLPPKYRVFVYYNITGVWRRTGFSVRGRLENGTSRLSTCTLSEINYPPFGYVMTIDSSPPDERLIEITHFARYEYSQFDVLHLQLPVLPTHLIFPGDYRTKDQIAEDYARTVAVEKAKNAKDGIANNR